MYLHLETFPGNQVKYRKEKATARLIRPTPQGSAWKKQRSYAR